MLLFMKKMSRSFSSPFSAVSVRLMRSAGTTSDPFSPFATLPPRSFACRKVIQMGEAKLCSKAAVHSISTLMPL